MINTTSLPAAVSAHAKHNGSMSAEPSVVFIHGMRTSSAIWRNQADFLGAHGVDSIAIDLPGHGVRSGERFSMPRAFEVVGEAIEALPADRPVALCGLSLGGYTALAFTAVTPGRVAGVVAAGCSSDPKGKPVGFFCDVTAAAVAGARRGRAIARAAHDGWLAGLTGRSTAPGGGGLPDAGFRPSWDVVTDDLTYLAGRSSFANIAAIDAPVWLVNGSHDPLRLEERRALAAAREGALVVVPGAGHDVNTDAPDAFNRVLSRALRDFARQQPAA